MPPEAEAGSTRAAALAGSAVVAVGRPANWVQLAKFALVGASGYVVNLAVYSALVLSGTPYGLAAVVSFLVAVTNNYAWNRVWTFRDRRGHAVFQGARFLVVSVVGLVANLFLLTTLVALGVAPIPAQAAAVALVMPWNFVANKLWSFRRARAS